MAVNTPHHIHIVAYGRVYESARMWVYVHGVRAMIQFAEVMNILSCTATHLRTYVYTLRYK